MEAIFNKELDSIGYLEQDQYGGWTAIIPNDGDGEATEAIFTRKRAAERFVQWHYRMSQRLNADEFATLFWLYHLSPNNQKHEAQNDPTAFAALVDKAGRGHGLWPRAVEIAREKTAARARVAAAGWGALLAL